MLCENITLGGDFMSNKNHGSFPFAIMDFHFYINEEMLKESYLNTK